MSQPPEDLLSIDEEKYLFNMIHMEHLDTFIADDSILSNNEDIKDIVTFAPNSTVLSKEQYAGPYDFQIKVDNQSSTNNSYMYSDDLNKVYTRMSFPIQVGFKLKNFPQKPLFIRATPVYSQPQHAQECVYRCINHAYSDKDVEEHIRQHILRCNNPLSQYLGNALQNIHLNILIPLSRPQTGTDLVMEMFQFVCQNSCPTPGMNRRHIQIIFTLESELGEIFGRQTFNVRVCCSPKRDMTKEMKEFNETNPVSRGKKRKTEQPDNQIANLNVVVDTEEYKLSIPIIGKQNVLSVLKYCQDLMAGELVNPRNKLVLESFRKCYDEISSLKGKKILED